MCPPGQWSSTRLETLETNDNADLTCTSLQSDSLSFVSEVSLCALQRDRGPAAVPDEARHRRMHRSIFNALAPAAMDYCRTHDLCEKAVFSRKKVARRKDGRCEGSRTLGGDTIHFSIAEMYSVAMHFMHRNRRYTVRAPPGSARGAAFAAFDGAGAAALGAAPAIEDLTISCGR